MNTTTTPAPTPAESIALARLIPAPRPEGDRPPFAEVLAAATSAPFAVVSADAVALAESDPLSPLALVRTFGGVLGIATTSGETDPARYLRVPAPTDSPEVR